MRPILAGDDQQRRADRHANIARQLGLAIQDSRGAYLTAWRAQSSGGSWVFGAMAAPPRTAMTAAELDGATLVIQVAEQPKAAPVEAPTEPEPEQPREGPISVD